MFRFGQDHARSNLIWNFKTREELRDSLESEMRAFNIDRELGSANVISWNHHEFEVKFNICILVFLTGMYYFWNLKKYRYITYIFTFPL